MKVLLRKFWEEPAIAGGVLTAILLALGEVLIGDGLTSSDLPAILAPVGLGGIVRQYVSPADKVEPPAEHDPDDADEDDE